VSETIATFQAILAETTSAFRVSNHGDGRIQFDVPESEFPEIIKLMAFGRDRVLKITINSE
jgi:hypothetical protein